MSVEHVDGQVETRPGVRQPFKVQLIDFVRQHPELWDVSMPAYRNNTLKSTIWDRFMSQHPGVNSKQVREQWRLIKNRYLQERELRLSGKDQNADFPYFEDCTFLERANLDGVKLRKTEESKDFLEDFRRVLSEANPGEACSPLSDNDLENNAPGSNGTCSQERWVGSEPQTFSSGPAETRAQLIDLVRDLPELYDKSNPLYKNNAHKGVLWSRIARQLGNGATAKKVREQWSYMRRKYEEEYFSRKAGQAPTPMDPSKRHLFTFDQLSFLEGYMQSDRPDSPADADHSEIDADHSDSHGPDDFQVKPATNINDLLWQISQAASTKTSQNGGRINMATGEIVYDEKPTTSLPVSQCNGDDAKNRPKKRRIEDILPAALSNTATSTTSAASSDNKHQLQQTINDLSRCLVEVLPCREDDECGLFGRQVAHDLRSLSQRSRLTARKRITDLLMELLLQDDNRHASTPNTDDGAPNGTDSNH